MASRLLLDTCAAIWISEDVALSDAATLAIDGAFTRGEPIFVSPITAWERGMLVSKGRLGSTISPYQWFSSLMNAGFELADMSPSILIDSSLLPGNVHGDPADRIIIATARALNLSIVTSDARILEYADIGHVRAIRC